MTFSFDPAIAVKFWITLAILICLNAAPILLARAESRCDALPYHRRREQEDALDGLTLLYWIVGFGVSIITISAALLGMYE